MFKKEYTSAMDSFELSDDIFDETRKKMAATSRRSTAARVKNFYRIAATIAIVLLVPTTAFAISKGGYLVDAFFNTKNVDDTGIQQNIVTNEKTILKDGFQYKVEEYLFDNKIGIGYLVYSVEREDGAEITKFDKNDLNKCKSDIMLTTNSVLYNVSTTVMHTDYEKENTPNKMYHKLIFGYTFHANNDDINLNLDDATLYVNFYGFNAPPEVDTESGLTIISNTQPLDQLIELNTSKDYSRFEWMGTEEKNGLTKVIVSPIGIAMAGTDDPTTVWYKFYKKFEIKDIILHFNNGTSSTLEELGLAADHGEQKTLETESSNSNGFLRCHSFSSILDTSHITSVTINGYEYK